MRGGRRFRAPQRADRSRKSGVTAACEYGGPAGKMPTGPGFIFLRRSGIIFPAGPPVTRVVRQVLTLDIGRDSRSADAYEAAPRRFCVQRKASYTSPDMLVALDGHALVRSPPGIRCAEWPAATRALPSSPRVLASLRRATWRVLKRLRATARPVSRSMAGYTSAKPPEPHRGPTTSAVPHWKNLRRRRLQP
jgi:hypothetical protein